MLKVSDDGKSLVGETEGVVVDGVRKAELLQEIAQREGFERDEVYFLIFEWYHG